MRDGVCAWDERLLYLNDMYLEKSYLKKSGLPNPQFNRFDAWLEAFHEFFYWQK